MLARWACKNFACGFVVEATAPRVLSMLSLRRLLCIDFLFFIYFLNVGIKPCFLAPPPHTPKKKKKKESIGVHEYQRTSHG